MPLKSYFVRLERNVVFFCGIRIYLCDQVERFCMLVCQLLHLLLFSLFFVSLNNICTSFGSLMGLIRQNANNAAFLCFSSYSYLRQIICSCCLLFFFSLKKLISNSVCIHGVFSHHCYSSSRIHTEVIDFVQ